jgi:L-alanine-DL-glutamate epimerase-like enolase superfamily enzyme
MNLNPPHEMGSMKPMGITQDILKNALEVTPGIIRLPSGPGLSAELDWDLIEKLRIGVGHG